MRLRIRAIVSLIAIVCAGCASQPAAPIVATVAPGQAKIVLRRANEGPLGSVHVAVNGTHLVDLDAGQSYTGGVPPGHVTLTASLSWDIGNINTSSTRHPERAMLSSSHGASNIWPLAYCSACQDLSSRPSPAVNNRANTRSRRWSRRRYRWRPHRPAFGPASPAPFQLHISPGMKVRQADDDTRGCVLV